MRSCLFALFILLNAVISSSLQAQSFEFDSCLVAHYPFNGDANDATGNGHDGTINGAVLDTNRFGQVDSAYSFDGIDDYIVIDDHPDLSPTVMTLSAWYKTTSFSGGNWPVVSKGYSTHVYPNYQYHLGVTGDLYDPGFAKFHAIISPDTVKVTSVTGDDFWDPDTWHFLALTYDGATFKFYIDNLLFESQSATGDLVNYGEDLYIGRILNFDRWIPGVIDDVRIYGCALSESEIDELFNEEPPEEEADGVKHTSLEAGILVYPNPTHDDLHFRSNVQLGKVQLKSVAGHSMPVAINANSIETKTLAPGIYFIEFYNSKNTLISVERIVKQ